LRLLTDTARGLVDLRYEKPQQLRDIVLAYVKSRLVRVSIIGLGAGRLYVLEHVMSV
jgi:hypothetical protein